MASPAHPASVQPPIEVGVGVSCSPFVLENNIQLPVTLQTHQTVGTSGAVPTTEPSATSETDMKRSKEQRSLRSNQNNIPCIRCKFVDETEMFAFRPLAFQELSVDCVPGKRTERCANLPVPEPRSGHRVVCEDGNMYSFGGYLETSIPTNWPSHLSHGTQRLFQELWCYNFAEAQWKRLPTLGTAPKELASHSAVLHGNYLVVFGGTGVPFGGCSSNKMNICDLRTLQWKSIDTTGEAPTPQYGQAVVMDALNNSFYVIGGTTGYDYSMDIHKLDLSTFSWETLFISRGDMDEPAARYRHEVAFDGKYIYILGGGTATHAYDLVHVPAFNVNTREWKTMSTVACSRAETLHPTPRKCQGSVQLGDEVFICGGYDSKNIFMDLWKLHLPSMQWTWLPVRMPVPLYFHSTSITKAGCMYVFGGVTHIKNNTRTNQVFKIWLKVPTLKEMCWEALLHYNKEIRSTPHPALLKMGIPSEFVARVHPAPPCGNNAETSKHWASDLVIPPIKIQSSKFNRRFRQAVQVPIGY